MTIKLFTIQMIKLELNQINLLLNAKKNKNKNQKQYFMIHNKLKNLTYFVMNNVFLKIKYKKLKHSTNMKTILLILVINNQNVNNLEKKENIEKETKLVKIT